MTLSIRPEMKMIIHTVDGRPAHVVGKTIDATGPGGSIVAMLEVLDDTELRAGARVRVSYVEPAGVHNFDTVLVAADPLTLNHRLVRVAVSPPTNTERVQRREDVRVPLVLDAVVELDDEQLVRCSTVDLSAGGIALTWDLSVPTPESGSEVRVRFATEHHSHDLLLLVVGTTTHTPASRAAPVVRGRFLGITAAERDRLVAAVFAAQREQMRQSAAAR